MTDRERLLAFFRENPNREVNAYTELVAGGLQILEYTGRISDVREHLGCTCGQDINQCRATEHVQNTRKGYYKFVTAHETHKEPISVSLTSLNAKRNALAAKWISAKEAGNTSLMRIIEIQGRAIKNAIDLEQRKTEVLTALL